MSAVVLSILARVKPAWVLSVAVHAGVGGLAYGATGHATAAAQERAFEVELIEDAPAPAPTAPEPVTPDTAPTPAASVASHTHDHPVPHDHAVRPHDPSIRHEGSEPVPAAAEAPTAHEDAPPVVTATEPTPPRFVVSMPKTGADGRGEEGHGHAHAGAGNGPLPGGSAGESTLPESAGSTPARLVAGGLAAYPAEARAALAEADVPVEIVVDTSGAVVEARVVKPAGFGFDASAVEGVRRYRFSPATLSGRAVRVRMRWSVQFRLR